MGAVHVTTDCTPGLHSFAEGVVAVNYLIREWRGMLAAISLKHNWFEAKQTLMDKQNRYVCAPEER